MSLAATRPRFSPDQALALAEAHFGLRAEGLQELPSERDQNFLLAGPGGPAWVLKISNAAESAAALAVENEALRCAGAIAALRCPTQQAARTEERAALFVAGREGQRHALRLLGYLPGQPLAKVTPHTPALAEALGRGLGELDLALEGLPDPGRSLPWELSHATRILRQHRDAIANPETAAIVDHFTTLGEARAGALATLRRSVIHHDANDYNVQVDFDAAGAALLALIDFGDLVHTIQVAEIAVAAAYWMLDKPDPLGAVIPLIRGYHERRPLLADELDCLHTLITLRLCLSVCMAAVQTADQPDNAYLAVSQQPARRLLARLRGVHPNRARATYRHACGLEPCPSHDALVEALHAPHRRYHPVLQALADGPVHVLDFSAASGDPSAMAAESTAAATRRLFATLAERGAACGLGRYGEPRLVYTTEPFQIEGNDGPTARTVHLGIDVFVPEGTPVHAPRAGVVHSFRDHTARLDYGPTVMLEHSLPGTGSSTRSFFTLYGHLSADTLAGLRVGQELEAGEAFARVGDFPTNGDWVPHLHFQVITDRLGERGHFPGVSTPEEQDIWRSFCPDPSVLLGVGEEACYRSPATIPELIERRSRCLGPSLSLAYRRPLLIVRGQGAELIDEQGRRYLDAINNVPHVGHNHPRVVAAIQRQVARLNTNTRYLHPLLVEYAERLLARFPDPLEVCYLVCSGSEANELALRLAHAASSGTDVIAIDGAYHGNTAALIDISSYKCNGPGGEGPGAHVQLVAMPDGYRGPARGHDSRVGEHHAAEVSRAIQRVHSGGRKLSAFIAESILGCGGQIVLPDTYLARAYAAVRAAGGVCIADEVQVGFGRVGSHFWAFETQDVVPDIVTLGKPIANGHPLGAVITTRAIADAFANGMEYFNTFGGNPVSCAAGLAVLDVIEDEHLQEHAFVTGEYFLQRLRALEARHEIIGEVRGLGLFLGVDLVRDRPTRRPAPRAADYVVQRMRDRGILLSTDGPAHNVLKLKPPLCFGPGHVDRLVAALDRILGETALPRA